MRIDHIAINAVDLEQEIDFLTRHFPDFRLLQKWEDL